MNIKCSVYIAMSVDGFIARPDGDVDWLNRSEYSLEGNTDFGYQAFIESVDKLVMGRNTYEKVLSFGAWPYKKLPVVVLSSRSPDIPDRLLDKVRVLNTAPMEVVSLLASDGAGHLYVDGGITIQRFLRAGLINEITITTVPVLLGDGIPLFGSLKQELHLRHLWTNSYPNGFIQTRYQVVNPR